MYLHVSDTCHYKHGKLEVLDFQMYPVKCTCFWIIICGLFVLLLLGLTFFICISMEVLRTYHPIRQKLIHLCIQPPMVNRDISELAFCTFVASVGMRERSGPGDMNSGRFKLTTCYTSPPHPPNLSGLLLFSTFAITKYNAL